MGKKQDVLAELFQICRKRGDFTFDNDLVEDVCKRIGFKNKFDITKIDNERVLPGILRDKNYAVIHLGSGRHQFIKGLYRVYHTFEPIETIVDWPYRKSLLNEYNSSESNILSVANNQRILHHFVFGKDTEFDAVDISQRPKTYFPHRTKADLQYSFGQTRVDLSQVQIEVDLTIEYQGKIGVFEAKNGKPNSFSIYQLYHPFLYYHKARRLAYAGKSIKDIIGVYVVRQKDKGQSVLKLWAYTFARPLDITSITLRKTAGYRLISTE